MNANPTKSLGRSANWYGPETAQPGLQPTKTLDGASPVTRVSWRCDCGAKNWETDGKRLPCASCGAA